MRSIRQLFSYSLGDGRDYYRLILIPQSFVFVVLIVLASFIYEEMFRLVIVHLACIFVVFLWSILFRQYVFPVEKRLVAWILLYEIASLFLALLCLSLVTAVHPLLGFYLPVGLILGACVVFDLRASLKFGLTLQGLFAVVCFAAIHGVLFSSEAALAPEGFWIVGFSLLLIVLRPRVGRGEAAADQLFEHADEEDGPATRVIRRPVHTLEDIEWEQLLVYSHKEVRKEFASEFSWRLGGVFLFFATTVLLISFLHNAKDRMFALSFLGCLFAYAFFHHSMLRKKMVPSMNRSAVLGSFMVLGMILLLQIFAVTDGITVFFLFILYLLSMGILPWTPRYAIALYSCLIVICYVLVASVSFPLPTLVFGPVIVLFSCRNSFLSRLGVLSRVVPLVVSQRMGVVSTRSLLYLLAFQMSQFVSNRRALVVIQGSRAEVIEGSRHWQSDVDEIFSRGLIQRVKDFGRDGGLLVGFNKQFRPAFRAWFSHVPKKVLFVRLTPVIERKAEEVLIIVPYTATAKLVGQHRLISAVSTASSLVRVWTVAARSRFLSSDVITTSQRSLKESEHELNQVVHRVNNVAQDIAIQCEDLNDLVGQSGGLADLDRNRIQDRIDRMTRAVRFLSVGVSDVKLIKELLRVKNYQASESVRLGVLLEELQAFGEHLSFQFESTFRLRSDGSEDVLVRVASREFLESCLRMAIRLAFRHRAPNLVVQLVVTVTGELVLFELQDSGQEISPEVRSRVQSANFVGVEEDADYLRALVNLARLSEGQFEFARPTEGFVNRLRLSLKPGKEEVARRRKHGDWVLLVDDNHEVTTFYSRIMGALELPHETADSLEAARAILKQHGAPRLLITDMQLGDGSGLRLVEDIRGDYGSQIPVFVVSGETDGELVSQAKKAGANLYLTKPVGRRKLFTEIQNVLR